VTRALIALYLTRGAGFDQGPLPNHNLGERAAEYQFFVITVIGCIVLLLLIAVTLRQRSKTDMISPKSAGLHGDYDTEPAALQM
jgi:hypothetical protein